MRTSIFFSYPKPFTDRQQQFVDELTEYLKGRGLEPRTLGVTDYDMDAPLRAIRRLMIESNGLICVAFRRLLVNSAVIKPGTKDAPHLSECWMTSPWAHIEPAMAFQLGLPVLILREVNVVADGILEKGVLGTYLPEFDLSHTTHPYLHSNEFNQIIRRWEGFVSSVVENRGKPPQLY